MVLDINDYQKIIENTIEPVLILKVVNGSKFVYEYMNNAAEKISEMKLKDCYGKTPHQSLPSLTANFVAKKYLLCYNNKEMLSYLKRLEYPCGFKVWNSIIMPLINGEGRVEKIAVMSRDLTDLFSWKNKAKVNERNLFKVINSMSEGLVVTDLRNKITFVNKSFAEMTGYNENKLSGFNFEELVTEKYKKNFLTDFAKLKKIKSKITNLEIICNGGGYVYVSIFSSISRCRLNNNKECVYNYITDLTYQKSLEFRQDIINNTVLNKKFENGIIGCSAIVKNLNNLVEIASKNDLNVLIEGESGTGKNLIARAIHNLSNRRGGPFVSLNCSAYPESLLESELFGYKKGAFTNAYKDKPGRFALAGNGTIFLDEIGDVPLHLQVKLLRVIEDKIYEPLGSAVSVKLESRIIAATNKDLNSLMKRGLFREDLYYRLKVLHLYVPALRERENDPVLLAYHILDGLNKKNFIRKAFSPEFIVFINNYSFPGNIRELINVIEHAYVMCESSVIELCHLPHGYSSFKQKNACAARHEGSNPLETAVEELEKRLITEALNIFENNKTKAAKYLNISRLSLLRKIKKYETKRPA